jgi:3-phenylpropionate/trans-cinnamate dioxygenase ferredoxin subunit
MNALGRPGGARPAPPPLESGRNLSPVYDRNVAIESEIRIAPIPPGLTAIGAASAPFEATIPVAELAPGQLKRVSFGDLDVLLAHTSNGIVAVDDRCPHMAAPLSLGELDGCLVACPLHSGQFDLATGDPTRMPTTGGLDADGEYHPTWSPPGKEPRPDPPGIKAEARRLTRVRRIRYYPARVVDGIVEIAVPRT